MNSAALTADDSSLRFAQSESKTVGMNGRLMDAIRDNAPRIVGTMKLAADIAMAFASPIMFGYMAFSVTGRAIAMLWGTKANQREIAATSSGDAKPKNGDAGLAGSVSKVLHPRQYPVEASSALSTVAEAFELGFGVSEFREHGRITPLLVGTLGLLSYANIVLGKEKSDKTSSDSKAESFLTFAQSESKPVGIMDKAWRMIKDNPVVVSSVIQLGISLLGLAGGLMEPGTSAYYIAANAIFAVANTMQLALVRKNDFNIEGAKEQPPRGPWSQAQAEKIGNFQERYVQSRGDSGVRLA